jgi:hypothetical protein
MEVSFPKRYNEKANDSSGRKSGFICSFSKQTSQNKTLVGNRGVIKVLIRT